MKSNIKLSNFKSFEIIELRSIRGGGGDPTDGQGSGKPKPPPPPPPPSGPIPGNPRPPDEQ